MAFERPDTIRSYPANADLRTKQYFVVTVNSGGSVALAGAGARSHGVLQNKPNTGQAASVAEEGDTPVYSGASINPGDYLTSDAAGLAVVAVFGSAPSGTAAAAITGSYIWGRAQTSAASADLFTASVLPIGFVAGSAV